MVGDRIPPDQYRLVTSVHEAGHAVIAERIGLRVDHIRIVHSGVGYTQPDDAIGPLDHEKHVQLATAGFAAVGECLGPSYEQFNRETDEHELEGSDLLNAIKRAQLAGVADGEIRLYIERAEDEVRRLLAEPAVRAGIGHIAWELDDGLDAMDGDYARILIERGAAHPDTLPDWMLRP